MYLYNHLNYNDMKRILILLTIVLSTITASAQHEAGSLSIVPKAGLSLANFMDAGESKMRPSLVGGVECEGFLTSNLSVSAGLLYSVQGAKKNKIFYNGSEYKLNLRTDYVKIPIILSCYYNEHLAFKTGFQVGVMVYDSFKKSGLPTDLLETIDDDISNIGYKYNRVDLSLPVAVSYEFSNIVIEARYSIGLTKLFKDMDTRTSAFQFTLGYKFKVK